MTNSNKVRVIKPTERQIAFLACDAKEVLFGGGKGPGKSFALVLDALGQVHFSDYRAVIFRKTLNELQDLLKKAEELYPIVCPKVKYLSSKKQFVFPSGATITFSFCDTMTDALKWNGVEVNYLGVDELGDWDQEVYQFLKTQVRTANKSMKLYIRATCNPKGRGLSWIRAYFVDPAPEGNKVIRDPISGSTRMFIPATILDNPHLNDEYVRELQALPEKERKALLEGDWNAYSGSFFDLKDGVHFWSWEQFREYYKLSNDVKIPHAWARYMSMDWGFAKPFAVIWAAVAPDDRLILYREYYGIATDAYGRELPNQGAKMPHSEVARVIKRLEENANEQMFFRILDRNEFSKNRGDHDPTQIGPNGAENFAREGLFFKESITERIAIGCGEMQRRFSYKKDKNGQVLEYPSAIFIDSETRHCKRTLLSLVSDTSDPEAYDSRQEDHMADAIRYLFLAKPLPALNTEPRKKWQTNQDNTVSSNTLWALGM